MGREGTLPPVFYLPSSVFYLLSTYRHSCFGYFRCSSFLIRG